MSININFTLFSQRLRTLEEAARLWLWAAALAVSIAVRLCDNCMVPCAVYTLEKAVRVDCADWSSFYYSMINDSRRLCRFLSSASRSVAISQQISVVSGLQWIILFCHLIIVRLTVINMICIDVGKCATVCASTYLPILRLTHTRSLSYLLNVLVQIFAQVSFEHKAQHSESLDLIAYSRISR